MRVTQYVTKAGVTVTRALREEVYQPADNALARALDARRGVLFSSGFEFPGRYTRWDMGFVDPPLALTARGRCFAAEALNCRGRILLAPMARVLAALPATRIDTLGKDRISGEIAETA